MARKFIDRVEDELDERAAAQHQRRYADTDQPVVSPAALRREQHREAGEIRGAPGVPLLTGPQARGMLWGGIAGSVVGAIVVGPIGFIPHAEVLDREDIAMPRNDPGPSIEDPERYEALREDGASKEKAARIANTDATTAGRRGGSSPPYEEWTKDDLYHRAQEIGIDGRSGMSKGELIDALRNH